MSISKEELLEEIEGRRIMVLSEDVVNPEPDRRCRHKWTKSVVWKKGMRFAVETFDIGRRYGDGPTGVMATTIALAARPYGETLHSARTESNGFAELMAKLVPAEKTVDNVLAAAGESVHTTVCTGLFEWMIREGKLTIEQFEEYLKEYLARNLEDES